MTDTLSRKPGEESRCWIEFEQWAREMELNISRANLYDRAETLALWFGWREAWRRLAPIAEPARLRKKRSLSEEERERRRERMKALWAARRAAA